jgi:hypothetical protein
MAEEVKKKPRGRRKKVKEAKKYAIPDDDGMKVSMIQQFIAENMEDGDKYTIFPSIVD